jgi:hypothetical protein
MGQKLVVGPINKGLRNDVLPFNVDNDSFPMLVNAYQWRQRIKRKRGTSLLGRLERFFNSTSTSYSGTASITLTAGMANILTGFGLQPSGNIVPGSVIIVDTTASNTYTDSAMNGTLIGAPVGTGTIDYASGVITIAAGASDTITVQFLYYPGLPVMGLRDNYGSNSQFSGTLGFDTTYSYNILQTSPYSIYDVSFYKNPVTATYPGYVSKTAETPTSWNGQDYQQFWTTNYQGALWTTNGIPIPFNASNISMQFAPAPTITFVSQTATTITLTITNSPLVIGDFVFFNEWTASTPANATTLNFQTGYVTAAAPNTPPLATKTVTITLPFAALATDTYVPGIVQYLTNRSDPTKDCLRWYDGDPTNGSPTAPILNGNQGWVNFAPPLSNLKFSISDTIPQQYYLVGARLIFPFKDRLLFFGPVIQTSTVGNTPIYLQDTVIYSQNGTPYYTASFTGDPTLVTTPYSPLLTPINQTATPSSYWEDITGYGGNTSPGLDQEINTVAPNEDVLIVGFNRFQTRLVYSGNDLSPFFFYVINSELGSGSTFSAITMDKGIFTKGSRGFVITSQVETQRIDLDIPDEIFQSALTNNGTERVCAQRDYINEWIYFTYPVNNNPSNAPPQPPTTVPPYKFPSQTLQYNYRDNSWAIFKENYTSYGSFRRQTGFTWATVGATFETWEDWNDPWNAGSSTLLQPEVIAGNQQGFILFRDDGTGEGDSLQIQNISTPLVITGATVANPVVLTLTIPAGTNNFVVGQMVTISGVVGMTQLNGNTYTITAVSPTTITISVNGSAFTPYISGGLATPLEPIYSPNHCLNDGDYIVISGIIGTVGAQLNGKIFSVQNPTTNGFSLNAPTYIPMPGTYFGGGLIQRMYVPFIQTKQFPVAWDMGRKTRIGAQQYLLTTTSNGQIQLLIFLSQDATTAYNIDPIYPLPNAPNPAVIYSTVLYTCPESTNLGLTPANSNLQMPTAPSQRQIWHRMNTSLIGDTVQIGFTMSDAQMRDPTFSNQFVEIELHSMVLDLQPSSLLA